ncbi:MAG: aspartate carbamoyltransferase catalytic subunit [Candidatus Atribacteria bacterium]|nr:aspartate carbamoyltransferase catalytic subunit [Candidatus Atribacteria bacterium]
MKWTHKDLLGINLLTGEEIEYLLERGNYFRKFLDGSPKKMEWGEGYCLVNFFLEPSTRTRVSFEVASRLSGMEVINFTTEISSFQKGESLEDTAKTLARMKFDVLVVRHRQSGIAEYLAQLLPLHVINAGDGMREHPTQALLDLLTLQRKFGYFQGLKVAIVGDILHSRVARSLTLGLKKLGAEIFLSGPPTLLPSAMESWGGKIVFPVEKAVEGVDVIYLLRIQKERQEAGYFPSIQEYAHFFGWKEKWLNEENDGPFIMHPGPVNRGVEIGYNPKEEKFSLIEEQVTCGVAIRMAVLETLLQGEKQ